MNARLAVRFQMLLVAGALLVAPSVVRAACTAGVDTDGDGADNCSDNCAFNSNASQADADGDGEGNECDTVFGFRSEVGLNMYEAPFAWEPITGTVGASTVTLGDDAMTSVAIGFTFRRLNGTTTTMAANSTAHTSICLGSNGWYHLDTTCSASDSSPNPLTALGSAAMATGSTALAAHAGPFRRYAPFWADLNPAAGGTISTKVIGIAPNRTFVVEFDQVPYADDVDTVTFQVRLAESDISSNPASIGAGRMEFRIKDGSAGTENQRWLGAESSTGKALGLRSGRVNDLSGLRFVGHTHPDRLRIVAFEGNLRPGAALASNNGNLLGALGVSCTSISSCVSQISTNALRSSSVLVVSSKETTVLTVQEISDLTSFVNGSSALIPGRVVWVTSKPLTGIDSLLGVTAGAAHTTEAIFGAPLTGQFHAFKPVGALAGVDAITGNNNNGFALTAAGNTFAVATAQLFRANGGRTYVSSNAFDDYTADANADGRADAVDWTANMVLAALFSGGTSDLASADFAAATLNDADNDGFDDRGSDNCLVLAQAAQVDTDSDDQGDACDTCPLDDANDVDSDTVCGNVDNCSIVANTNQLNSDADLLGDACDTCPLDVADDVDIDTVCGDIDNCPSIANLSQADADADGIGDACDTGDTDGDGTADNIDGCPLDIGKIAAGVCGCGTADTDTDTDTIADCIDNCPLVSNEGQGDLFTAGGFGDACDGAALRTGALSTSHTAHRAPFAYESIAAEPGATAISLGDDAFSGAAALPFAFSFFGVAKTNFFVGSNGLLAFTSPGAETGSTATLIPSAASLEDFIAGFWTDLDPSQSGTITTLTAGTTPSQTFTVEWDEIPTSNGAGNATFQIVLFETTGRIEIRILSGPASSSALRAVGLENSAGSVGLNLRGATNQSLNSTRFVIWPQANRPKVAVKFATAAANKGDLTRKHICDTVAASRPLDSLLIPCTTLTAGGAELLTGGFSLYSFEAFSPSTTSLPAAMLDNVETFIGAGGSAIWAWNRGTTAATPTSAALTTTLRDAFGISAFGSAVNTPLTMAGIATIFSLTGTLPNLTPSTDVGNPNGTDIDSLSTGIALFSGGTTGGIVRNVSTSAPSFYVTNALDDYRTDASFTGTRYVDADGDGIGDMVEFYRAAVLNGLYLIDTNNNGIDDRDPDLGP